VKELNETREDLEAQVGGLEKISDDLTVTLNESVRVNANLNNARKELMDETNRLKDLSNLVSIDIGDLLGVEANLTDKLNALNTTSMELTMQVNELVEDVANFTAENERLGMLNKDLNTISNNSLVLNLTASATLTDFTDFLARKIEGDQNDLLGEQKQLIREYKNAFEGLSGGSPDWSCVYGVHFGLPAGTRFTNTPINDTLVLDSIIDYIDERLFVPLCLSVTNFREFLDANATTTSRDINMAVDDYTDLAEAHYFGNDSSGVTTEDWINASFSCDKLVNNYLWQSNIFSK